MFYTYVSPIHSLTRWLPMWMSVMYVNWIVLVFLKCPTRGMSPLCYLSYLSEWWEVDRTHVIACKILVEVNGSTTITPSTSCLHTRFPGNHLPTSSTGWTRPTATLSQFIDNSLLIGKIFWPYLTPNWYSLFHILDSDKGNLLNSEGHLL